MLVFLLCFRHDCSEEPRWNLDGCSTKITLPRIMTSLWDPVSSIIWLCRISCVNGCSCQNHDEHKACWWVDLLRHSDAIWRHMHFCQYQFRLCLVTCSAPSHYWNSYWIIVNLCLREKLHWILIARDQSHKSHNASVPYPTIHHIGTDMCIFLLQYGVLWDVRQVHYGIWEIGLF